MTQMLSKQFIFFDEHGHPPAGWSETLSTLRDFDNHEAKYTLARLLVGFAEEFSLIGNVWQQWLTYVLMFHENVFSLSVERREISEDASLLKLAESDFEIFQELFRFDFSQDRDVIVSALTDYKPVFTIEKNRVGQNISEISKKLAAAGNIKAFSRIIIGWYQKFGAGIYGSYRAFRIVNNNNDVQVIPVVDDSDVCFDELIGLEEQKKTLKNNTEAFLNGIRANNVLLYGDAGTGKSTSVHALMHDYYNRGLRLVEISKQERHLLPQLMACIKKRNYHFIIFLDDLSFEENESDYKELKAMLEGALEKRSDRILIYATSNRRHLIRETWTDRNDMEYQNDIHHSDTMEEKLSLASRFGILIYYSKPDQKEYNRIVHGLAKRNEILLDEKELYDRARKWELRHGGMSGRTASQLITWLQGDESINNYSQE